MNMRALEIVLNRLDGNLHVTFGQFDTLDAHKNMNEIYQCVAIRTFQNLTKICFSFSILIERFLNSVTILTILLINRS